MNKKNSLPDSEVDAIAAVAVILLAVAFAVFWVAGQ